MKQMIESPVKQFALAHGLKLWQPTNLKSKEFAAELLAAKADLQVVVAFRMLPLSIWSMPSKGTINLHGSLLPAYRGAAPIQWAIIRGETTTGVTTFMLQQEIDTGAVLLQRAIPILNEDDAGSLHDRMMHVGAGLVVATVDQICEGTIQPKMQDDTKASHAPKIFHQDGHIDWKKSAVEINNLVRGLSPVPGAWSMLDEQEIKIWKTRVLEGRFDSVVGKMKLDRKSIHVQTGHGIIELMEVQPAGKRRMKIQDFINGYKIRNWSLT